MSDDCPEGACPVPPVATALQDNLQPWLVQAAQPVLVVACSAPCGPCEQFKLFLPKLAIELGDAAPLRPIDIADHAGFAAQHATEATPTLLPFHRGACLARRPMRRRPASPPRSKPAMPASRQRSTRCCMPLSRAGTASARLPGAAGGARPRAPGAADRCCRPAGRRRRAAYRDRRGAHANGSGDGGGRAGAAGRH